MINYAKDLKEKYHGCKKHQRESGQKTRELSKRFFVGGSGDQINSLTKFFASSHDLITFLSFQAKAAEAEGLMRSLAD